MFRRKLSIQHKTILLVYGILLIIGITGAFALLQTEWNDTITIYNRSALTLAQTIQQHLLVHMQSKSREYIQQELTNLVTPNGVVRAVMILSREQQIYASNDASQTGQSVNWELVARTLESGNPQYGDYQGDNANQLSVVLPVSNGPGCHACHDPQTEILGAIKVHVDKRPLNTQLRRQVEIMVLIGSLTLLSIGAALTYTLRQIVVKPMTKIAAEADIEKEKQGQLYATSRLAAIGELASGVAHELNNPLASVMGFSQLLLQRDVPDDVRADIMTIYHNAERASKVVKNLLNFARKHPEVKEPVDINETINAVLGLRTYEQKANNIKVDEHFAPDLPRIMGDGFQLQQVFMNLIINAEYFMLEAHNKGTLSITTERVGNVVRVSFADDGPGIPKENLGHLFNPFFTTKPVGKGTGLGLSICHGIVTSHGGRVYAESEFGKGATFVVELPIIEEVNSNAK